MIDGIDGSLLVLTTRVILAHEADHPVVVIRVPELAFEKRIVVLGMRFTIGAHGSFFRRVVNGKLWRLFRSQLNRQVLHEATIVGPMPGMDVGALELADDVQGTIGVLADDDDTSRELGVIQLQPLSSQA